MFDRPASGRLADYVRQAWPVLHPARPYIAGWHIDAITEHLEAVSRAEIQQLVISVPPRHTKSLSVSVAWPTWDWIDHPDRAWLFGSHNARLSTRDAVFSRRVLESSWYQQRWGCKCERGKPHAKACRGFRFAGDQNTKTLYENDRGGRRLATSTVPGPLGEGGDIIVLDDPHNPEQVASDTVRERVIDAYEQVWVARRNDPKKSAIVLIMQRLHERDLTGHVLAQGGWVHLCLPTEYEIPPQVEVTALGFRDPRKEPGELLCPARLGPEELEREKRRGSFIYAAQHQQRPAPAGGGVWKTHWWRFWYPRDASRIPEPWRTRMPDGSLHEHVQLELPLAFDEEADSWDMAFKDTKASSYVVGQGWGRVGAAKFLLDQVRDRLDFPSTVRRLEAFALEHPLAAARYVEDKANGPAVIASLRGRVAGLIPVEPEGSKEARAAGVSPTIEAGDVYLPHPSLYPWVQEFLLECAAFPNGEFNDQVDATSQLLRRWQGREWAGTAGLASVAAAPVVPFGAYEPDEDEEE